VHRTVGMSFNPDVRRDWVPGKPGQVLPTAQGPVN